MHAGMTSVLFLRENLEWLGKATNWAKFSATAGLGVIHRGNFEESMNILGPYLPAEDGQQGGGIQGAQYSEGGSLYALASSMLAVVVAVVLRALRYPRLLHCAMRMVLLMQATLRSCPLQTGRLKSH